MEKFIDDLERLLKFAQNGGRGDEAAYRQGNRGADRGACATAQYHHHAARAELPALPADATRADAVSLSRYLVLTCKRF